MTTSAPSGTGEATTSTRVGRTGMVALLALTAAALVGSLVTLDLGSFADPDAGFWVACIAAAAVVLCAAGLLSTTVARDEVEPLGRPEGAGLLLAAPALLFTVPLLTLLGIITTTALVSLYWLKVPMRASWLRSAITAGALTASIYIIFIVLLRVPFPVGSLTGI